MKDKKQPEEKIKSQSSDESVDEKELLFQSSNDLMMYIDKFGKLLKINKAGLAFSGFSEEEIIGKMFWKLPGVFSTHNAPKYLKVFKNALKGKPTRNFVGKLDDKSGKTHIMDFSAFPVKENKKLKYVFVVAKELTEQKETESRYRLITENTDDLIAVAKFSLNPKYTYISPSHEKIMGYKPEELLGKPCLFFVHPDDKKKLISLLRKYVSAKGKKLFTGKDSDVNAIIEYRAKDKSGNWHYLESTANIMGNELLFVSKDITEHKKAEESLQKAHDELEESVRERTAELSRANEVLQIEITERNKAEEEIKRTKDYLDNVIDSASEFILVVDMNYRVSTWNKTAERLTGYKKREVLLRSINSLNVFLNSKDLQDDIKNIQNGVEISFSELILRSKTGAKKLVRVSGSIVLGGSTDQTSVLFIGKEITQDSEMRGKLLQGNSYLITDKSSTSALNLLVDLAVSGSDGLFITRGNPNVIQSMFQTVDVKVIIFSRDKYEGFENVSSLGELTDKIKEFVAKKSKPVVLIDRVDYLLTNFSFEAFVKSLYEINNIISTHNAILLMRVNSDILNASQLAFIEEELKPLPSQRIDAVELDDQVYGVLTFIDKQNKNNVLVSFKKISQEFSISKVTTAKRLNMLDDKDLIFIKKQGKSKTVHISDRGKLLLGGREFV